MAYLHRRWRIQQIFSIYKIEAESYYITTDFTTNAAFAEFANTLKARSVYDFGVELGETDKMLTLSTCYNTEDRFVVHAVLVNDDEISTDSENAS